LQDFSTSTLFVNVPWYFCTKKQAMDKTKKQMLLDAIGWLYEKSDGCQLSQNFLDKAHIHMELLAAYLQVSPMQAFLMAVVCSLDINGGSSVNQKDLSRHFGCNPIKVLSLSDELEVLCQRNILIKEQNRGRRGMARAGFQYTINAAVIDAILKNMPMPQTEEVTLKDVIDVLERVCELSVKKDDDLISTDELFERTIELMEANKSFPVVQKITKLGLDGADIYLLCYIIWRTVTGREYTDIGSTLKGMFNQPSREARYVQSLPRARICPSCSSMRPMPSSPSAGRLVAPVCRKRKIPSKISSSKSWRTSGASCLPPPTW